MCDRPPAHSLRGIGARRPRRDNRVICMPLPGAGRRGSRACRPVLQMQWGEEQRMKRFTVLAAVVVAALAVVGAAQAGNPDGLGPWADYVVANNQGCAFNPPDMVTCVPV